MCLYLTIASVTNRQGGMHGLNREVQITLEKKKPFAKAGSHKEVQFNLIRRKQRLTPTDFLIRRGSFALFDKLEFVYLLLSYRYAKHISTTCFRYDFPKAIRIWSRFDIIRNTVNYYHVQSFFYYGSVQVFNFYTIGISTGSN